MDYNPFLTSVTLPTGLTTIDTYAFRNSGLISVTIPDAVVNFGSYPFLSSLSLQSFSVGTGSATLKSIDGVLYSKNGQTLIEYPDGKTNSSFVIPDGVTTVLSQWVWYNEYLLRIVVPASVTTLGYGNTRYSYRSDSYMVFLGNSEVSSKSKDSSPVVRMAFLSLIVLLG